MKKLIAVLAFLFAIPLYAGPPKPLPNAFRHVHLMDDQGFSGITLQFQNGGSLIATYGGGLVTINCSTGMTCSASGPTVTMTSSGGSSGITNQVLNQLALGGASASAVSGTVANGKTGQVFQSTNAAAPSFVSPGLPWGNGSAAVTTTPYAVACDSGTAVADRGTTILFQSGASVINLPDPTAAGCTGNFAVSLYDDGAGSLTVNRGGTSTINVVDGSTNTDAATSFTLATGQYALCNANAAGTIWACAKKAGGTTATSLVDSNAASVITTTPATTPVNFITCGNAATGALPFCQGAGSDATVGMTFGTKATNNIFSINADGSMTITPASTKAITFLVAGGGGSNVLAKTTTAAATPLTAQVASSATANAFNVAASSGTAMSDFGPNGIPGLAQTCVISGADYTNSTTTPSTVCSFTLPPTVAAKTYIYTCDFMWESTAATLTGPVMGLNLSAAPTQLTGEEQEWFAVAGTFATGYLSNTTTGSQTLLTGTAAGVTSTNYKMRINGTIEGAATAGSTFIINAAALSNTTSTLNIRRGGSCIITALP